MVRHEYVATPRADKKHFAKLVHAHIRSLDPPGRFLKRASEDEPYIDIGVTNAINKTSQALREGKPQIDKKIKSGEIVVKKLGKVSPLFSSISKHQFSQNKLSSH